MTCGIDLAKRRRKVYKKAIGPGLKTSQITMKSEQHEFSIPSLQQWLSPRSSIAQLILWIHLPLSTISVWLGMMNLLPPAVAPYLPQGGWLIAWFFMNIPLIVLATMTEMNSHDRQKQYNILSEFQAWLVSFETWTGRAIVWFSIPMSTICFLIGMFDVEAFRGYMPHIGWIIAWFMLSLPAMILACHLEMHYGGWRKR